jgi:eukaryotic-like serine/threonine-protein kinase
MALRLEAYAGRLPILGPPAQVPLDLIAEEYRVRRRFGDAPDVQEYFARFTHPRSELAAALDAVNRELNEEREPLAPPIARASRRLRHAVDPQAPLFYGDYVLKRQIGSGGLCRVYAGVQLSLRKEVALKVLLRSFWNSAEAVNRFLREAQIVAQLPPDGIVGIHGLGRLPRGGYFMVMDLVDGQDLRAWRNAGAVPPAQAARWVAALAEVLGRVHAAGFVHGDLKPANILDFGFSRAMGSVDSPRYRGEVGGTPAYLAPELAAQSQPQTGPTIDIFGLGGVLLWLLSGRAVHEESNTNLVLTALAQPTWDAQVPARMPTSTPTDLVKLCHRCLARNPDDRPSLGEIIKECRAYTVPPDAAGA